MTRPLKFVCFLGLLLFASCEEACDQGPFYGNIKVRLTINDENPEVFVVIFDGKLEERDTLFSEYVSESPIYYEVEAGRYYSGAVSYHSGLREVVAIDGKRMKTSSDDNSCEYAEDFTLNLRLAD